MYVIKVSTFIPPYFFYFHFEDTIFCDMCAYCARGQTRMWSFVSFSVGFNDCVCTNRHRTNEVYFCVIAVCKDSYVVYACGFVCKDSYVVCVCGFVCKDSYVVYACGFDRNGKLEWFCESKWRCKNDIAKRRSSPNDVLSSRADGIISPNKPLIWIRTKVDIFQLKITHPSSISNWPILKKILNN